MSAIVVRREHQLDLVTARRMAESVAGRMKREFGGAYGWDGDTLRFSRTGASGHVDVGAGEVTVRVDLGLLLRPLRSRIEREIQAYLAEQLGTASARSGRRSTSAKRSQSLGVSKAKRSK